MFIGSVAVECGKGVRLLKQVRGISGIRYGIQIPRLEFKFQRVS